MPDADNIDAKTVIDSAIDSSISTQATDRIDQYKILLGTKIVAEMGQALGEEGSKKFLEEQAQLDQLLTQNPDLDIISIIPVDQVGQYSSFTEYLAFLRKLHSKLAASANSANNKVDENSALNKVVNLLGSMIEGADSVGDIATAAAASTKFTEHLFKPIATVPIQQYLRPSLPKSYPDYVEIARYVHSRAEQAEFNTWLVRKLNGIVRIGLERLVDQKNIMAETRDKLGPKDYLVELKEYLMDNGWVGYGKDDAKEAVAAVKELTRAGYTTNVEMAKGKNVIQLDIDTLKSNAYLYLGVTLDRELRLAVYRLADSVNKNYNIDGKQAGMDVLMAASSEYVQDFARQWLVKLLKVFNDQE